MPHHLLSTNSSFCISLTCIKWSRRISYLFIQFQVQQVISLFITTLIWGQMSFQHWLLLSSFGTCMGIDVLFIHLLYLSLIKTYLGYVGLGWQMYLCLITFECIWLCSAGKKHVHMVQFIAQLTALNNPFHSPQSHSRKKTTNHTRIE